MLQNLRAINFRCWTEFNIELPSVGGLFIGANAQGKTSILEAVCILLRLHSPRTNKMRSVVKMGENEFGAVGTAWNITRKVRYNTNLALEVDNQKCDNSNEYLAHGGLVVWMGNEDLELVRGSGDVRRRYLDFVGSQFSISYRRHLSRYKRALKTKNILLKESQIDEAQISAYEEIMIESGQAIAESRQEMIGLLTSIAASFHASISEKNEFLSVNYQPAGSLDMRCSIEQARDKERRLRQSAIGPHRDEMQFLLNGLTAVEFASEGQQRTLALSLKLAQGELLEKYCEKTPVYLLDDIFGELDTMRRNALIRNLPSHAQKLITTTNIDWIDNTNQFMTMKTHKIIEGKIKEVLL
jgi:DNA replication and repair protein RecF